MEFAVLSAGGMSAGGRRSRRPACVPSDRHDVAAFILGVVPLAISSGGLSSRHAIGTGVIGGMLAATFIATFFIPMFYRLIAWKAPKPRQQRKGGSRRRSAIVPGE